MELIAVVVNDPIELEGRVPYPESVNWSCRVSLMSVLGPWIPISIAGLPSIVHGPRGRAILLNGKALNDSVSCCDITSPSLLGQIESVKVVSGARFLVMGRVAKTDPRSSVVTGNILGDGSTWSISLGGVLRGELMLSLAASWWDLAMGVGEGSDSDGHWGLLELTTDEHRLGEGPGSESDLAVE